MPIEATSIFGSTAPETLFSAGLGGGATEAQLAARTVVEASKREINKIRGYKLQLTPADNKRLADIQEKITRISAKAANGTIRSDEIETRKQLYLEADTILGKPSAGVEIDKTLEAYRDRIDEILAPRFTPPQQKRLDTLDTLLASYEERLTDDPSNVVTIRQIQNVQRQIARIDVPRQVSQLSVSEKNEYDRIVEKANDYAGAKLLLNARESVRVQHLQETIDKMAASLPPDPAGQPTASSVARAYARFS